MTSNLVTLSKFERTDIVEPTEQQVFCLEHYREVKGNYKDFQIRKHSSSMPKTWCETCTPAEYGY